MEDRRWKCLIESVLCMAFSAIFINDFLIYDIAMILVLILESIFKKKIDYLVAAVVLGLSVICAGKVPIWVAHRITLCVTDSGLPTIGWVAMGLKESYVAPDWYSGDSVKVFAGNQ